MYKNYFVLFFLARAGIIAPNPTKIIGVMMFIAISKGVPLNIPSPQQIAVIAKHHQPKNFASF